MYAFQSKNETMIYVDASVKNYMIEVLKKCYAWNPGVCDCDSEYFMHSAYVVIILLL